MSSSEDQNFIGVLPEEVLSEIFKWLDLRSVKNASLVCQQWSRIIFSNHNIQRFCLVLDTRPLHSLIRGELAKKWDAYSKWAHRKRKQFRRAVQHDEIQRIVQSQRCYRSLSCEQTEEKESTYLFKSLHPWKTEHLHTLKIDIKYQDCTKQMLNLFASVIRCIPQLHSLVLSRESDSEQEQKPWVELHSKTERNLLLNGVFPAVFDMPALQTLTTVQRTIHQAAHNFPLENMKELTLKNPYDESDYVPNTNVHQRLTNLETLRYNTKIKEEEFLAVCKHSRLLKELVIERSHPISQERVFYHLAKLTNLRRLSLLDINIPGTVNCDLVKLSKLEYLNLGNLSVENSLVLNLPQSITNLTIKVTPQNERSLMRVITSSLPKLKMLSIHLPSDDRSVIAHAPIVTLRLLPLLTCLEVFEFSYGYFSKSCLFNMSAPMQRLRKLRLERCRLETKTLKGLHEKFPKLKELGFECCRLKSGDVIVDEYRCF
ncbi:uncharacterized protein LOC126576055 isoform X2 [Anopheles aquasalis]|uniref:uncharacterized protein LOC126576055 isoform X2 n=1 Tax=Anopheles aquasalis TaxID=42839 RepID=UPI00215AEF96|nr:uncharacterized protein LOC126576055 isoform X2 [Anopheles aquasalis]